MLTLEKFEEASEIVKRVTRPTKLIYSEYLSSQTGGKVYLKPENMQYTGAYKLRGAYYKISTLSEEDRAKGLITASAGNHAQGVAYAAKAFGCKATIVMPTVTPLIKVNRTKSYGAEVVLHGDVYDDACAKAYELAEEYGYTFVHPFDDLDVATGQGTIAMEIVQELPTVDYILAPIGGGGLITGVTGMLLGAGVGVSVALSIQVILLAVFTALGITGTKLLSRVKRFQIYIEELQGREYVNVKDLALKKKKKEKFVVKDLETMIRKGWFLQGHLDEQKACLMTSREAFEQYQELMAQARQQKAREQESKERQKADADRRAGLDPKVQEVIEAGNAYIRKIRECNDAIPGEVVSEKMSRMELLTKRIFARVEQNPEVVTDIRRLMEYYLPTAVKLLEAYEELDAQPVQGENILSSKKEIEDTLDTLNIAFEKLLDDLFQETAWDVSSDISVLKTMLAQEGLTKNDFSTGGK